MALFGQPMDRLCVPAMDSNEVVVVPFSELPRETEETLDLLASEAVPLSTWFDFARAYLAQGLVQQFTYLCEEATKHETITEIIKFFSMAPTYTQIQFYCAQAAVQMAIARDVRLAPAGDARDAKAKRTEALQSASKLMALALALDPTEQLVMLGNGQLHLAKGEVALAKSEFTRASNAMNNGQPNAAGVLALAALQFTQRSFKQALALYRGVLRQHPGCPPEVRLGIAACLFRLADMPGAKVAYERVAALEPNCADAFLGLAAVHFNLPNAQQGLADGLVHLVRAYNLNPHHVGVLHLLSQLSLAKGQYDRVLVLSRNALDLCETDNLRADFHTYLARAHHALGQFPEAERQYQQASRLDTSLPVPRLGLAQMELRRGVYMNAATELEKAISHAPNFTDALKILGQLYPHNPVRIEKTIAQFKDAASKRPDDGDIWQMLGELLSPRDPAGSLKAYRKALDLQRRKQAAAGTDRDAAVASALEGRERRRVERAEARVQKAAAKAMARADEDNLFGESDDEDGAGGVVAVAEEERLAAVAEDEAAAAAAAAAAEQHHVPAKLLNNTAVLLFRAGEPAEALALVEEATDSLARGEGGAGTVPLQQVTVGYNRARLQEACGDLEAAKAGYKAIVEQFPEYIDCYLRLACIAASTGAHADALQWAQRALEREGGHADALAVMGALHLGQGDFGAAKDALKKLVGDNGSKGDTYGRLALGNVRLYMVPPDRHRPEDTRAADDYLKLALQEFTSVLSQEPTNVFAANGVGAVLAELGHLDEAKEIFTMVQEASVASGGFLSVPDVVVNLANVHLAKQDYATAIYMYKTTLAKHHENKDPKVLLYLARAHYDSNDLPAAKQCLLRAIHAAPADYRLRFNVALTMQEWGVRTYRKRAPGVLLDQAMLDRFRAAEAELAMAQRFFDHLKMVDVKRSGIPLKKLDLHVKFCQDVVKTAHGHVEHAEREMEEINHRRMESEAKLKIAEEERTLQEQKKLHLVGLQLQDRHERAAAAHERQERMNQQWKDKRGTLEADNSANAGFADADGGGGEKKRKGVKKEKGEKKKKKGGGADKGMGAALDAAFGSGDEGLEEEPAAAEGDLFGDEEDGGQQDLMAQAGLASDDDEEAPAAEVPSKKKKRRLGRSGGGEAEDGAAAAAGLQDDEDDLQDNDDGGAGPNTDGAEAEAAAGGVAARKRARTALDSEEEEVEEDLFGGDDEAPPLEEGDEGAAAGAGEEGEGAEAEGAEEGGGLEDELF